MPVLRQHVRFEAKGVLGLSPERFAGSRSAAAGERLSAVRTGDKSWTTADGAAIGSEAGQAPQHGRADDAHIPAGQRNPGGGARRRRVGGVRARSAALRGKALRGGSDSGPRGAVRRPQSGGLPAIRAGSRASAASTSCRASSARNGRRRWTGASTGEARMARARPRAPAFRAPLSLGRTGGGAHRRHDGLRVTVEGETVRYSLTLDLEAASKVRSGPPAGRHDALAGIVARHIDFRRTARPARRCPARSQPAQPGRAIVVIVIHYACAGPVGTLTLRDKLSAAFGREPPQPDQHRGTGRHAALHAGAGRPEARVVISGPSPVRRPRSRTAEARTGSSGWASSTS